jgi:hypothetical protein
MVRALLERTFHPARRAAWFEQSADAQYTRAVLFSTLVELMSQVVCGVRRSVHAAYPAAEPMAPSVGAGYRKLARIEPTTVTEWVRYSAPESRAGMDALESTRPSPSPGYGVKILDGQVLAAPEHRLQAWRLRRAGAWPGKAGVVDEPARNLMVALWPCEHGQAQERSRLPARVAPGHRGAGGVGDRPCGVTACLVGIAARGAYGIVREHEPGRCTPQAALRDGGRVETGPVAAQRVGLPGAGQVPLAGRRLAVRLDQPPREGDPTL